MMCCKPIAEQYGQEDPTSNETIRDKILKKSESFDQTLLNMENFSVENGSIALPVTHDLGIRHNMLYRKRVLEHWNCYINNELGENVLTIDEVK